jgi:hypothetical protein
MRTDQRNNNPPGEEGRRPSASTGNASNPSPRNEETEPMAHNQLLDKKAETYLRESANIEDMPDAEDQQEANETFLGNA